jgi:hypothetical protein
MSATVERLAALIRRALTGNADSREHFSIESAFAHRVIAVIGEKNRIVRPDCGAVCAFENTLTPGTQIITLTIENDDRMLSPGKTINTIVSIHGNAGHFFEFPIAGQLAPFFDDLETVFTAAQNHRHVNLPHAKVMFYSDSCS